MNDYIVVLKGTNKDLATTEFETLWKTYFDENVVLKQITHVFFRFESKVLLDSEKDKTFLLRLTFTNNLSLVKFYGSFEDYSTGLDEFDIDLHDGKKFAVKSTRMTKDFSVKHDSKKLATVLHDYFKDPKIDLDNPDIEFIFFFENPNKFYFCERILENKKDYLRRMPKLRPIAMPYTLKSDMARAAVNMLGLKEGIVLDPFCGIGGILLEAYDMGFEVIGNDISWNDLKYFKENFEYFYPDSDYTRILADSRTQFLKNDTIDGIVTDIPYGKSSRRKGDVELYEKFLIAAKKYLKPKARMIVIYANFVDFKETALKYFDEVKEIDQFINRSMTRYILILRNSK